MFKMPTNYKQIKMPFGKYKGRFVWEIADLQYFRWLCREGKITGELLEAVRYKIGVV
ncbi:MAG: DUF3820 family protein [Brumimicrobium sp.]|nr:DUF3820 family protein [Brumimicrobium sp.]